MGYKKGANINDLNKIRAYMSDGYTAEEISRFLLIDIVTVSGFMHSFSKKDAPKVVSLEPEKQDPDEINPSGETEAKKPARKRRAKSKEE